MLKHLIGVEISPLRSALIFSYIGGILLVVIGLTFALPSTWVIFKDDFPGEGGFPWILASVGLIRILFTYLFARGIKFLYYLIILLSVVKVLELFLAASAESLGFAHPANGEMVEFKVPVPDDFGEYLSGLREQFGGDAVT